MKKVANRQFQLTYSTNNNLFCYDIGSRSNSNSPLELLCWTGITENNQYAGWLNTQIRKIFQSGNCVKVCKNINYCIFPYYLCRLNFI